MLAYRPATKSDLRLVVDSWVSSYRTAHAAGMIAMDDWREVMCAQVQKVLDRPGVEVLVAYKPGESPPLDVYGWLALEREYRISATVRERSRWGRRRMVQGRCPLVHYVYVLDAFREKGVARGLFRKAGVDPAKEFLYSCKTGFVSKLLPKIPLAKWRPLIARYPKKAETNDKTESTHP